MEFLLPKSINKFIWSFYPVIIVLSSFFHILYGWELQKNTFHELENFGRLLFVLGLSACESALMTVVLWWIIMLLKGSLMKLKR